MARIKDKRIFEISDKRNFVAKKCKYFEEFFQDRENAWQRAKQNRMKIDKSMPVPTMLMSNVNSSGTYMKIPKPYKSDEKRALHDMWEMAVNAKVKRLNLEIEAITTEMSRKKAKQDTFSAKTLEPGAQRKGLKKINERALEIITKLHGPEQR